MIFSMLLVALIILQEVASDCYIANKYTQARKRLGDPITVASQYDCTRACECANGVDRNCASLSPPVPLGNCLAYTFDPIAMKCNLLGEIQAGVCSNPGTVYIREPCGTYPTCGETTLEQGVICDSTGYVCPEGNLIYALNMIKFYDAMQLKQKLIYYGGTRIYFEDNLWNIFTDSLRSGVSVDKMQSMRCFPAIAPTYPACGIKPILFGNALLVKDTFQCLPGSTWSYFESDRHYETIPVCSEEGWRESAGGALLPLNSISTVRCD